MVQHNGFTFICDLYCGNGDLAKLELKTIRSERTAIRKAREARWFIGTVRITGGYPKSKIRTLRRVLCPCCTWVVGAR